MAGIVVQPSIHIYTPGPFEFCGSLSVFFVVDKEEVMKGKRVFSRTVVLLLALLLAGVQSVPSALAASPASVTTKVGEADAAHWGTWVLESADELRPVGPPDAEATAAEMAEMMEMAGMHDDAAITSVGYWNAGAPGYRWVDMTLAPSQSGPPSAYVARALALVNVAIYDATIATWDAKYTYNRPRPAAADPSLLTLIPTPDSPSYPEEYAAAAGAAAAVLAYLFPDNAALYAAKAEEAGHSRVVAGVAYPSDVEAGLALGQAVAEKVIAVAMTDGSDAKWDGTRPDGPGILTTETPVLPMAGTWRTWTLESADQFRAPPPPAYDSEQTLVELTEIKTITRTFPLASKAMFWHTFHAAYGYWFNDLSLGLFETKQDRNPPQAALAYSALAVSSYDSIVACFESKYAYWRIRPNQLDPEVTTLFNTPGHPSYPAAHACASTANSHVIGELIPSHAESILAAGAEAGQSRIWAGIHYRSDVNAGSKLGADVAGAVLARVHGMREANAPKFGSKAWKIAVAMTGGPSGIAKDATILDWPVDGADPVVLREGTNGWVCRPDHPATPTNDPRCFDPNWRKLFPTAHGAEREALNLLGFGYMLQWGDAASHDDYNADEPPADGDWVLDGPHLMINISGDFDESYMVGPEDGGPYVMFHGFSQEHLMIPTPIDQVVPSVNPIYDAMSAAPLRVSEDAAVMGWPSEASGGEFVVLREGTNGWTCMVDDPSTPTHDPMCVDENFMEFLNAIIEGWEPAYAGVGMAYMLRGGSAASNEDYTLMAPPDGHDWLIDGPHVMFVVPWDLDPALYSTDHASGGPYIMWEGTPYEHIMAPVTVK